MVIRIPLPVHQMSALAGYFTDGPSMMALYGLVSRLETDARFTATGFGLVVETYASDVKNKVFVTTGFDVVEKGKQASGARSMLGFRYADMTAALYLETESLDAQDKADLVQCLADCINTRRVQGGNLIELIDTDPEERWGIRTTEAHHTEDLAGFIASNEKPISKVYVTRHLPEALEGDALIEAYAEALTDKDALLVCNGYRQVGEVLDGFGQPQRIGDNVFTLAQAVPVHQLKALPLTERAALLDRFFWSFDRAEYDRNPNHFILS